MHGDADEHVNIAENMHTFSLLRAKWIRLRFDPRRWTAWKHCGFVVVQDGQILRSEAPETEEGIEISVWDRMPSIVKPRHASILVPVSDLARGGHILGRRSISTYQGYFTLMVCDT
jgi:hypothetical protein